MNSILKSLGSYQILTNFFPGVFFILSLKFFYGINFYFDTISENIMSYYFIGFIINRIGSLVVEPILMQLHFITFASYNEFARSAKADSKLDTLLEISNYIRSLLTCVLLLPLMSILHLLTLKWEWFFNNWKYCALILLIALFAFAYKKQISYIYKRVNIHNY